MREKQWNEVIVGFGGMGNWHRELIEGGIDHLHLKGIYDIAEGPREKAGAMGYSVYESLEAVLADPEVDIILCSTPNDCHKEIVLRALRAGKHVIAEKPVALCSADLQEMIQTANETGRLFTVHQNRRWDEDFLTIKKIYDDGMLGEVFNIESRVHGSRGIPGDWRKEKAHGGGMMLDWGVHIIDQALQMIPEKVKSVYCTLTHVTNEEVDDGFTLVLTFESGLRYLLEVGTSHFISLPRWYIQGMNGSAVIRDWSLNGEIVRVTHWDQNDAVPIKTAAGLTKTMAPRTDETIASEALPVVCSDIRDFYRNIVDTLEGKAQQKIQHSEIMRVMKLMEAAFQSAQNNQILPFE